MGRNNDGTRLSVTDALEIARDTPAGEQDATVVSILESAIIEIWGKIEAHPTSYVMSRDEFAVFNYFQSRFEGNDLASSAIRRYWNYLEHRNGA